LEKRGGFSEAEEIRAIELEVRLLTQERNIRVAREKLDRMKFLPQNLAKKLKSVLAHAIDVEPGKADGGSRQWAEAYLSRAEAGGRRPSKGI